MEALSPMGETIMDTSSVLQSPQSSRLMMGLPEESMDTLVMSPQPPEPKETNKASETPTQSFPAPVFTQEGAPTIQGLNTQLAGSFSNVMLPGLTNTAATAPFLLNATSPTTVAAPILFNQSNLTTATASAPQFLMNAGTNMQPNTTFLLNTNPAGGNMQTILLNPNMAGQGTPLVVQTPVTNTAFFLNSSVLNTSPNTLLLTHPSLSGSNSALMLATNQGAAAIPQAAPQMLATNQGATVLPHAQPAPQVSSAPTEHVMEASGEVNVQQNTHEPGAQIQTVQLPVTAQNPPMVQTDTSQNIFVQNVTPASRNATSSPAVPELEQGVVEENSILENKEENKDMLALRLKLRRPREELVSIGIMPPLKATTPAFHEQRQRLERAKVGDSLQRKMRMRPDKAQLVHQHILEDTNMEPMVSATHQRLKRARIEQDLDCKIKNRPGPLELIEGNILKAESFVEQAVKDGKIKFLKTSGMDPSPYNFDEDSQEGCSDEPMSPSQAYSHQSDNPPSSVGSVPSPPDFSSFLEQHHHVISHSITSSSPTQNKIPSTPPAMITIKQEPGVTSPPPIVSLPNAVSSSSSSSSSLSLSSSSKTSSSSSSSKNARKKQAKRNKVKEIKFHEYKPPNEQASKLAIPSNSSNPYNLLLMQQQLLLQLQLLQQQQHQLILPNTTSVSTSSKLSPSNPGVQSPSSTTVTSSSSPTPLDNKPSIASTKMRTLSNLEDMKVSELKLELKNRGLHVSGTKPQLVERLRPYADISTSPCSTATSSTQDVTSSSTCLSGNGTKVTSSTDVSQDMASDTNSTRASVSSPPASPQDFKSPVSVASETSDPASPGSAFDPMSPSTFPMAPPPSVTTPSLIQPVSSPPMVFSQSSEVLQKQASTPSTNSFQVLGKQPAAMEINENSITEMMDLSVQLSYGDQNVNSDLLRKQQQKIEQLQRALQLSQLQLRQHQIFQTTPPPPPPPPPPHPATTSAAGAASMSPQAGSPIKLAGIQGLPQITLPSSISQPTTLSTTMAPPPVQTTQIKAQSPTKQASSPVFQSQDFIQSFNQQQRAYSFSSPPAVNNNQPFQFSKAASETKPATVTNGIVEGQKSSSVPSSPTDPVMFSLGVGALPSYTSPPPNYEEAVRQTKERKAHLGSLLNPGSTETGEPRMTKSQDLDDLLEVLVDHGYQIPVTPKTKEGLHLGSGRLPHCVASMPNLSLALTPSGSTLTQSSPSTSSSSSSLNHQQLQHHHQNIPSHPPPPHPQQQQQQHQQQVQVQHQPEPQSHCSPATPISIPLSTSAPSPSMELPMDVDSSDLSLSGLDLGKSRPDLPKEHQLGSSTDKDNGNILPFDIPSMQIDSERETSFWTVGGDNASPSTGMLSQPPTSDGDMNWLDMMMSSSGSGLTPVNATPPTSIGAEGSLGSSLGKEVFSLNLFDLNDDAWDSIHVTERDG